MQKGTYSIYLSKRLTLGHFLRAPLPPRHRHSTMETLTGQHSALSLYKQHSLYLDTPLSVLTFRKTCPRLLVSLSTYFQPLDRKGKKEKCYKMSTQSQMIINTWHL